MHHIVFVGKHVICRFVRPLVALDISKNDISQDSKQGNILQPVLSVKLRNITAPKTKTEILRLILLFNPVRRGEATVVEPVSLPVAYVAILKQFIEPSLFHAV